MSRSSLIPTQESGYGSTPAVVSAKKESSPFTRNRVIALACSALGLIAVVGFGSRMNSDAALGNPFQQIMHAQVSPATPSIPSPIFTYPRQALVASPRRHPAKTTRMSAIIGTIFDRSALIARAIIPNLAVGDRALGGSPQKKYETPLPHHKTTNSDLANPPPPSPG